MTDIDAMFSGMAEAQMNGKGNYMGEGRYLVQTKVVKYREGHKGKSFIVEFEVLESSNTDHEPGSSGSWVVKLDRAETQAQAWGDLKAFLFAIALGRDPKTVPDPKRDPALHAECTKWVKAAISEAHAKSIGQEPGFLNGLPVRLECVKITTTKGKPFTVHNWSPYEAPQPAQTEA